MVQIFCAAILRARNIRESSKMNKRTRVTLEILNNVSIKYPETKDYIEKI